ncbi:MAG: hypothetical protein K9L74_05325 [Candidatus Izimaplasma sp.]|nr:hypothetical protein [Candidatus Izimaplasma bacterium]
MLNVVINKTKDSKYIWLLGGLFIFFFGLYVFLDFEGNGNYSYMAEQFGFGIVSLHIIINIIIALLTSMLVTFSIVNYKLTNTEPTGSNAIPFVTFLFGLLTFGCTSCVVAFLGAVGIAFTPLVLPNGNLLWKFIALVFVIIGFVWILYTINNAKCNIKK